MITCTNSLFIIDLMTLIEVEWSKNSVNCSKQYESCAVWMIIYIKPKKQQLPLNLVSEIYSFT